MFIIKSFILGLLVIKGINMKQAIVLFFVFLTSIIGLFGWINFMQSLLDSGVISLWLSLSLAIGVPVALFGVFFNYILKK